MLHPTRSYAISVGGSTRRDMGRTPWIKTPRKKIINQGFYWITLQKDTEDFVKHCKVCQNFGKIPRLPSVLQIPVLATWPFYVRGIDLMGKFFKSRGNEYLIVTVDYFSKWIETKSLAAPTEENTLNILHDFVLCRYGVPRAMVGCGNQPWHPVFH